MFLLSRTQFVTLAAASVLAAFAAILPAGAVEPLTNLGPVGPYEPILAAFGSKRLIAFYVPDSGRCSINAVVFDAAPSDAPYSSSRVRIKLWPGETFDLDGPQGKTINLQCGDNAANLALSGPAEFIGGAR